MNPLDTFSSTIIPVVIWDILNYYGIPGNTIQAFANNCLVSGISSAGLGSYDAYATSILDLTPLVSQNLDRTIIYSGLPDIWPDLDQAANDFANAAANRARGSSVDTKKLEQFREKIKRGRFPDQETFTWQGLGSSIDRYFNKEYNPQGGE